MELVASGIVFSSGGGGGAVTASWSDAAAATGSFALQTDSATTVSFVPTNGFAPNGFAPTNDFVSTNSFAPTNGFTPINGFALETASVAVERTSAGRTVVVAAAVATLMAAIAILGLVGNCLVVLVTIVDHDLKEHVSNIIIGNLALADLSTCLLVVLPSAASLLADHWPFGQLMCWLHCGFNYLFIIVSMMSLALVSMDRKSAVEEPLRYIQRSRPSRLVAPLLLIWATGALFALIPITLDWIQYDYWEGVCAIGWFQHRGTVLYVIVAFCVCFLLPAGLIVWSNHIIVSTSHRVSRRRAGSRKIGDTAASSQRDSLSVRRLYNSLRLRGRRAVRLVRGSPVARVRSSSLRAAPVSSSGGAVQASGLHRTRSEPRRSLRLDVAELVSGGSHNIESMFSEFDYSQRRRSLRADRSLSVRGASVSDHEFEVPTMHMPDEVRKRSDLQPIIDKLRIRRSPVPKSRSNQVNHANQEVMTDKTTAGDSSSNSSSDSGGGGGYNGNHGKRNGVTLHCESLSEAEVSPIITNGTPRERSRIILPSNGSYAVPAAPRRLSVKIVESHTARDGDHAGVGDSLDSLRQPLDARPLTTDQERHLVRSHRRIIRSISIVVAIFFVCMTPFCVTKLVKIIFLREDLVPGWLNLLASVVQFMSSATNPFIYGFFRPDFKRAFMRIYRKIKISLVISRR